MVARFQSAPKETHVVAVKRIFLYLRGTMGYGLWYPKGKDFTLIAYSDADWWAGCVDDRKSTSVVLSFLVVILLLGIARSKIQYPYRLQNRSILQLFLVAPRWYG